MRSLETSGRIVACVLMIAGISSNPAESATLKLTKSYYVSADVTGTDRRTGEISEGDPVVLSFPKFDTSLGTLTSDRVRLEGDWTASVESPTIDGNAVGTSLTGNLTMRDVSPAASGVDGIIHVEGVGLFAQINDTASASGSYTSPAREGLWQSFGADHAIRITPTMSISPGGATDTSGSFVPATGNFSASGTVTSIYDFALSPEAQLPAALDGYSLKFSDTTELALGTVIGLPPGEETIGIVKETSPGTTIRRADGTVVEANVGTEIAQGDVIETTPAGSALLEFIDDTEFAVSNNARLEIDEYVFDPADASERTEFSLLRGLFVFTAGFVGREDPEPEPQREFPKGSIGFRAELDLPPADPLNIPEETRYAYDSGSTGFLIERASPVGISTLVDVAAGLNSLSFSYAFLTGDGTLEVSVGGIDLFQLDVDPLENGLVQSLDVEFDFGWDAFLGELAFVFDGTTGGEMLLWNIVFNGVELENLSLFSTIGDGPVNPAFIGSENAASELISYAEGSDDISAVPAPSALVLLLAGIGCLGALGRRHRSACQS